MSGAPDFERLYRSDADPWRVASSHYEQRKLDLVLACLSRAHYALAWDPACGTGHLAARLATRATQVLATDLSETAVALSSEHCRGLGNVRLEVSALPAPPPADLPAPDLVLVSEFFYYLTDRQRVETLDVLDRVAGPACELLAVHWRHVPQDAWLGGAGAQQEIVSRLDARGWTHRLHHDDEEFVIDTLDRGQPEDRP